MIMQRWIAIVAVLGLVFVAGRALAQTVAPICPLNVLQPESCLYLPMLEKPAPTPVPTVVPSPSGKMQIINSTTFINKDYGYVSGEVENGTAKPVSFVKVLVRLYDNTNTVVVTQESLIRFYVVFPGQRVPFTIGVARPPSVAVRGDATITSLIDNNSASYGPVTVVTQQIAPQGASGYRITGTVQNTTSNVAQSARVAVTFYDAKGAVVYSASGDAEPINFAPGQSITFGVNAYPNTPFDHYLVQAQSSIIK